MRFQLEPECGVEDEGFGFWCRLNTGFFLAPRKGSLDTTSSDRLAVQTCIAVGIGLMTAICMVAIIFK